MLARRSDAQRAAPTAGVEMRERRDSSVAAPLVVPEGPRGARVAPSWWTPLTSSVAPGAGQAILHQNRWVAYAAVEAYALARYAADAKEGQRQRDHYRGLARNVARSAYPGPRPDGSFDYYERMEHYARSGAYDQGGGSGALVPEGDTTTSNGALWLLARQTYWEDPSVVPAPETEAYRSALDFYTHRAIRPGYLWSWAAAPLEHDVFRADIARSNTAFRRSVEDLGAVLANHLLSTVDAYVTVRLRRRPSSLGGYEVGAGVPFGGPARH